MKTISENERGELGGLRLPREVVRRDLVPVAAAVGVRDPAACLVDLEVVARLPTGPLNDTRGVRQVPLDFGRGHVAPELAHGRT